MLALAGWALCALVVLYVVVLYPLWLRVGRFQLRPAVQKQRSFRTTVTIVIAVYNGAAFLRTKLESLLALEYDPALLQILIVSDGSTDQTEAIVQEYADRGVTLLVQPHQGKSAAVNLALAHATGEILFFTDVRQPLESNALAELVANFADPSVGAVTGEMKLLPGEAGEQQDFGLYWKYEIWARSRQSAIDSLFNTTGCIYAIRRSLAAPIPEDTLSDDAILPLGAFFAGYRVIFDPAAIAYDYPAVPGTEFRRRWRNLAGLWQVHRRLPQLFTASNRMRWHFLPHKFGRLALPWALLGMLGFTLLLPAPWRPVLLTAELFPMLLGLVDPMIGKDWELLKKLSSVCRTFLTMNVASLAATAVFFIPAQRLWKPTKVTMKNA